MSAPVNGGHGRRIVERPIDRSSLSQVPVSKKEYRHSRAKDAAYIGGGAALGATPGLALLRHRSKQATKAGTTLHGGKVAAPLALATGGMVAGELGGLGMARRGLKVGGNKTTASKSLVTKKEKSHLSRVFTGDERVPLGTTRRHRPDHGQTTVGNYAGAGMLATGGAGAAIGLRQASRGIATGNSVGFKPPPGILNSKGLYRAAHASRWAAPALVPGAFIGRSMGIHAAERKGERKTTASKRDDSKRNARVGASAAGSAAGVAGAIGGLALMRRGARSAVGTTRVARGAAGALKRFGPEGAELIGLPGNAVSYLSPKMMAMTDRGAAQIGGGAALAGAGTATGVGLGIRARRQANERKSGLRKSDVTKTQRYYDPEHRRQRRMGAIAAGLGIGGLALGARGGHGAAATTKLARAAVKPGNSDKALTPTMFALRRRNAAQLAGGAAGLGGAGAIVYDGNHPRGKHWR